MYLPHNPILYQSFRMYCMYSPQSWSFIRSSTVHMYVCILVHMYSPHNLVLYQRFHCTYVCIVHMYSPHNLPEVPLYIRMYCTYVLTPQPPEILGHWTLLPSSGNRPCPQLRWGHRTPPIWMMHSSVPNFWYLAYWKGGDGRGRGVREWALQGCWGGWAWHRCQGVGVAGVSWSGCGRDVV